MKTIGLIGGMSWLSSSVYYEEINKLVHKKLGGIHSAQITMHSVDYEPYYTLQKEGKWAELTQMTIEIANNLIKAGADCILICCNTMHMTAQELEANISVPFLHIADATAAAIQAQQLTKVAFLGTTFTTNNDFFRGRMLRNYNIESIVATPEEQEWLQNVIYDDFCRGVFTDDTRQKIVAIIDSLKLQGAQGVVLGCTELPIIIRAHDTSLPIFNTTHLHAAAVVNFSLA
jgi:aspartate racemase